VFPAKRDCTSPEDNDCDGAPDNTIDGTCTCAIGTSQACGAHPNRDGNGPCKPGQQRCEAGAQNASSRLGACSGAVGPALRDSCTTVGDDADCSGAPNTGCQCIAGQGNAPCSGDPNNSRCNSQGVCVPCQANTDCSLVSGGRNLCIGGRCAAPTCGDGIVQPDVGEECDDGGTAPGDGCTPNCRVAHAPVGVTAYGGTHMCMIKPTSEIVCWGTNESGELGNGRTAPGTFGATAVFGISDAAQLSLGPDNVCAVRRSGLLSCWGLGFTPVPTNVVGLTGVTQVAVASDQACVISGARVSCALKEGGTPYGAFSDMGLDAVTQISAGNGHVCALRSDGTVRCWGSNNAGQLGIGQPGNPSPTPLLSLATGVAEVAAGGETTCVRLSNGSSQCFGSGPLGSRTAPTASPSPQTVVNLPNPLRFTSLTNNRCALLSDQSVRCLGTSPLGDSDGLPVAIALPGRAVEIGAGSEVACAVLEDLSMYCWGQAVSLLGLTPSPAGAQVPVRLPAP
jgi:cysteine-rich repeat protein